MITAAGTEIDAFITADHWGLIMGGGNAASNQAKQIQTEKNVADHRGNPLRFLLFPYQPPAHKLEKLRSAC